VTPPPVVTGDVPFGGKCTKGSNCTSGVCLANGRCSQTCRSNTDCPSSGGWYCGNDAEQGSICYCGFPSDAAEICDGLDNNCDGQVDEVPSSLCAPPQTCGGAQGCQCPADSRCAVNNVIQCVDKKTNPFHCGACGEECTGGEVCTNGTCGCAGANGKLCVGARRSPEAGAEACFDLSVSRYHCGQCTADGGEECRPNQRCEQGVCVGADPRCLRWQVTPNGAYGAECPQLNGGLENVFDPRTGLVWEKLAVSRDARTLAAADALCRSLPSRDGLSWRIPTRAEITTIIDFSRAAPALSPVWPAYQGSFFWTSTEDVSATSPRHWILDVQSGTFSSATSSSNYHVRCVRYASVYERTDAEQLEEQQKCSAAGGG